MEIPKYNEMCRDILAVISDGNVYTMVQLLDLVAEIKGITPEDRLVHTPSGKTLLYKDRVHWGRIYLQKAGLVKFPRRGTTQITNQGKRVLEKGPAVITNEFLMRYETFRAFIERSRGITLKPTAEAYDEELDEEIDEKIAENATPAERMEEAFSELNAQLEDELLAAITSKPRVFFEKTVMNLLVRMGYGGLLGEKAGRITQATRDEGIDGIIQEDKLGFSNIFIQAKRMAPNSKVGRPAIQSFVGAIANKVGRGLFITTGSFAEEAKDSAKANHIVLIDGNSLASLMIEHGVGVSTTQTFAIKKVDSDFFIE
jgi:restriction system protein